MPSLTEKLPRSANEGDEVLDRYGGRWRFHNSTWIFVGTVSEVPIVTEDSDGLATPDVYRRLALLPTIERNLKLFPGIEGYWYWLRSSSKMFRFTREGESNIRIELDRGRLFQHLAKARCQGSRGQQGKRGPKGKQGRGGAPEPYYQPSAIEGNRLDFAIFTPYAPSIGTPISIRLVRPTETYTLSDQLFYWSSVLRERDRNYAFLPYFAILRERVLEAQAGGPPISDCASISQVANVIGTYPILAELLFDTTSGRITLTKQLEDIDVEKSQETFRFDQSMMLLCGSLYQGSGHLWAEDMVIRVRQRGPTGNKGVDADGTPVVVDCGFDSSTIAPTCPLVAARLDCVLDSVYTVCGDVWGGLAAEQIAFSADSAIIAGTDVLASTFIAAEVTLDAAKEAWLFNPVVETEDGDDLELTSWEPQTGCFTTRSLDKHRFDWIPATDVQECTVANWFDENGLLAPKYPFGLQLGEGATSGCCQDDFFYCPNVQFAPLPVVKPIVVPPAPPPPPGAPPPPPGGPPPPSSGGCCPNPSRVLADITGAERCGCICGPLLDPHHLLFSFYGSAGYSDACVTYPAGPFKWIVSGVYGGSMVLMAECVSGGQMQWTMKISCCCPNPPNPQVWTFAFTGTSSKCLKSESTADGLDSVILTNKSSTGTLPAGCSPTRVVLTPA